MNEHNDRDFVVGRLRDGLEHVANITLACYVDNRLSIAERIQADEHLAKCPACVESLANVAKMVHELKGGR